MSICYQFTDITYKFEIHAQVYVEIDKVGEELVTDPENKLASLLFTINDLFSTLEASIGHIHAMHQVYTNKAVVSFFLPFVIPLFSFMYLISMSHGLLKQNWRVNLLHVFSIGEWCLFLELTFSTFQSDSSVDGSYSIPLLFEKLPEINQEGSQWTDCEIRDAINSIYQNLDKLESYISSLVRASILCHLINFWRRWLLEFLPICIWSYPNHPWNFLNGYLEWKNCLDWEPISGASLTFAIYIGFNHLWRFWSWTIKPLVLIIQIGF